MVHCGPLRRLVLFLPVVAFVLHLCTADGGGTTTAPLNQASTPSSPSASSTSFNSSQPEVAAGVANPSVGLLADAFKTDVANELPQEDLAQDALSFEWGKLLNTSTPAPFLSCAGNGRAGVAAMLGNFSGGSVVPFYSTRDKNLTCYVIYSSAPTLLNATSDSGGTRYAAPVPTVLKVADNLFDKVSSGAIFQVPPSTLAATALRVVFAPGVGQSFRRVSQLVYGYREDLRQGSYKDKIARDFLWSPSPSNTTGYATRERAAGQRPSLPANQSVRASQWLSRLAPVLNGTLNCTYRRLNYAVEKPYLRISSLDTLLRPSSSSSSSCLMALLAYLVSDPSVFYLEEFPRVQIVDQVANYVVQSATPSSYPISSHGIDGRGQVIQITDTGLDMNHCLFQDARGNVQTTTYDVAAFDSSRRKVIQYVMWADSVDVPSGHGTHVNGIAAGYSSDPSMAGYTGAATGAKIAFFDVGDSTGQLVLPSNIGDKIFPAGYTAGARVFSVSWGSIVPSYTYLDSEMDHFMASHWDALLITAAGNDGPNGLRTVYSPAQHKNGLTVGATESTRSGGDITAVAYFSSLGFSADGRIKPDVVTPGRSIISARAGTACSTVTMSGTSMATPVASGMAALVRQYYQDGWYPTGTTTPANGFNPSGALVKATMINSAVGMKYYRTSSSSKIYLKSPPDQYQGHGRVKLDEVLKFGGSGGVSLFVADRIAINEGGLQCYKFTIPLVSSTAPPLRSFKVTVVWTEQAATANSAYPVFHNLDLYVTSDMKRGATTYYANGKAGYDAINTVEKVVVSSPSPGDVLTAYVKGTSISTTTSQPYSLVASGDFFPGAWFCQNPSKTRTDSSHRTANCFLPCAQLSKNPVCCPTTAGGICTTKEIAPNPGAVCDPRTKPSSCVARLE